MEIIAEISGNHGGKLENAIALIHAAIDAGADAVKFQCFNPLRLARKRAPLMWEGRLHDVNDLLNLYCQTHTPQNWFPTLIQTCKGRIAWLSSVFDPLDVEFMEGLGCPRYKISAYEMLDGDLISAVTKTGKPIILSVRPRQGVTILRATDYNGKHGSYGLSDHSKDNTKSIAAAAMNCPVIERHICLDDVVTPDSSFSLNPDKFTRFVDDVRASVPHK